MPSVTDLADDDRLVHRLGRIGEGSVTLAKVLHGKPISIRKSLGELNDAVDSYARLWASSAILLHTLAMPAQCDYNAIHVRGLS